MTTPIYQSKTWQYANNSAVRTAASVRDAAVHNIWYLCALLTGNVALRDFDDNAIAGGSVLGKWTIEKSSNGVVQNSSDNLHIAGAYTLGDWVQNTPGNAHSWVVLKSPVSMGPFYLCFDDSESVTYAFGVFMSKSPFTLTAGSLTARPTASNECGAVTTPVVRNLTISGQGRKRAALCTDGNFFMLEQTDGQGRFSSSFIGATLAETRTNEAHNFWWMNESTNNIPGIPTGNPAALGGMFGRDALGTGAAILPGLYWLAGAASGSALSQIISGRDATDNAFGNQAVVVGVTSPASERGRLVDITWCAQGVVDHINGDLIPATGIGEFVRAAYMYFPSNGVMQVM